MFLADAKTLELLCASGYIEFKVEIGTVPIRWKSAGASLWFWGYANGPSLYRLGLEGVSVRREPGLPH